MSVWSLEATIVLVALIAAMVFAISRIRLQNRRRNTYRRRTGP